jgi:predicted esterase
LIIEKTILLGYGFSGCIHSIPEKKLIENIKNKNIPVLLIHGTADRMVDFSCSKYIYDVFLFFSLLITFDTVVWS